MYKGISEAICVFQVVAAAVFTTTEWMEKTMENTEKGVKGVKDSFVEGRVAKKVVVLEGVEEEVLQKGGPTRLVEVVEGTLGGAEGAMKMIPAEEEEDHITMEKISKTNVVTIKRGMAT